MRPRSAYTILDLAMLLAALAVIVCVLAPTLAQTQSAQRLVTCSSGMRQTGMALHSYVNTSANYLPTYTWRTGVNMSQPGSPVYGRPSFSDVEAAGLQARDLIWRRSGGYDIGDNSNWIPHILYSPLVLTDFMNRSVVTNPNHCLSDRNRPRWLAERQQFLNGNPTPPFPSTSPRWCFSSSYQFPMASFAGDGGPTAITFASTHNTYQIPATGMTLRRVSDVRYPDKKVAMYDEAARHMPEREYHVTVTFATQPLLFYDGSVRDKMTASGNRGFNPLVPTSPNWLIYSYDPNPPPSNWEPPVVNPASPWGAETLIAHFRATRSGLKGRDFDGPEVPWPPP